LKEAGGVCGGRGQVMEKVKECGLMSSRDERIEKAKAHIECENVDSDPALLGCSLLE
jgi:hypothetical protein